MKPNIKMQRITIAIALMITGFGACERISHTKTIGEVQLVRVSVNINVVADTNEPLPPKAKIKFANYGENIFKEVETDGSLKAVAEGVVPGIYTLLASAEYDDGEKVWMYNGSLPNITIVGDVKEVDLDVKVGATGPLAFKELYYCGSQTPNLGSYYYDQFYEVYNNSETTVYLDSICFTILYPSTASAILPIWEDPEWEEYVFGITCWQFPGNGTDYPLHPGETVVLAGMAVDHRLPENNPASPVNLQSADFEFYVDNVSYPKSNPSPSMNLVFGSVTSYWLTTVNGAAFVLFRQTGPIDRNFTATQTSSATRYLKVRRKDVIDAVECVNNWTRITDKRMPVELDAGAITVDQFYTAQSVARKIKSTRPDGTNIYQDTNNSLEDFEIMNPPVIRRNGAKIPSWNTWH